MGTNKLQNNKNSRKTKIAIIKSENQHKTVEQALDLTNGKKIFKITKLK